MLDLALTAQVLIWLLVAAVFLASRQASVYHPLTIYLALHGIVFVLRPLLVHYLDFDAMWKYMTFEPSEQDFIRALEVSSFGLVVFALATLAFGWCRTEFAKPVPSVSSRDHVAGLVVVTVLLAPIIAYSLHASLSGGVRGEHIGGTYVMTGSSGYTAEAQYMAGPLICAWLAVKRFKWQALLLTFPYVLYRSYAGWSRWTFLLFFLAMTLIYAWQKRIKWPPTWAVFAAVPLLLLFHALGQNREYVQQLLRGEEYRRPVSNPGARILEKWRSKYDGPDFANFDFLTFVTAVVPERTGTFTRGAQYLQLFTEPIPRKLWSEKPAGAPVTFFNLNNYGNFLGMTVSLAGDGWISGGWIGVAITMGIVGAMVGSLHRWFWRRTENNMVALFYLVGLAVLPQWLRDGGISIAKFVFWNLSPLLLWMAVTWFIRGCRIPAYCVTLPSGGRFRVMRPASTPPQANHN